MSAEAELTAPRELEPGIDYLDGARVTVGWSESDGVWYARCFGAMSDDLGHGDTREEALLCLITAMSALITCLYEERA